MEYNLTINEVKRNLATVQRQLADAIIERDKVLLEIKSQRAGSTIVKSETEKKDSERYSIISQIEVMSKTLSTSRDNFLAITDKEKEYIKVLEDSIREKEAIDSRFSINSDQLKELEKNVSIKQLELKRLYIEANKESDRIEKDRIELNNEKIAIAAIKTDLKLQPLINPSLINSFEIAVSTSLGVAKVQSLAFTLPQ